MNAVHYILYKMIADIKWFCHWNQVGFKIKLKIPPFSFFRLIILGKGYGA
jgi:hypothetical protein